MVDWNAVAAIGQVAAAIGTLATLAFAVRVARNADLDVRKASRAVLQHSRLTGAGLRLLAISASRGNDDGARASAIRELEQLVKEVEDDHRRDQSVPPHAAAGAGRGTGGPTGLQ